MSSISAIGEDIVTRGSQMAMQERAEDRPPRSALAVGGADARRPAELRLAELRVGARGDRMVAHLEQGLWLRLRDGVRGRSLPKDEEEAILGFDRDGA